MQKNRFIRLLVGTFFILAFSLLLKNSFDYLDVDFGWHIKIGQEILTYGAAPTVDIHNYPILGRSWVDHEWLFNVVLYWLYDHISYFVLSVLFVLLALSIYVLVYFYRFATFGFDKTFFAIFSLVGIMASQPQLGIRMQELSHLFVLLLLVWLDRYSKTKTKNLLWFLPILFVVWANFHGSFLIGYFILGFWVTVKTIEYYFKSRFDKFNFFDFTSNIKLKEVWLVAAATVVSFLATLINPYGWHLYQFLLGYTDSFYLKRIEEWTPIYYWPINPWGVLYFSLVVVSFVIYFVSWQARRKKDGFVPSLNLWHLCLIATFLVLSFSQKRHMPLLVISSLPWLIHSYSRELFSLDDFLTSLSAGWKRIARYFVPAIFCLAVLISFSRTKFNNQPFGNEAYCKKYPCAATDFLRNDAKLKEGRLLNEFGWGGYLMWVWPEKTTFIDGRFPQYQLSNHSFLEEYLQFFDKDEVGKKLDEYKIDVVLMRSQNKATETGWLDRWLWGVSPEDSLKKSSLIEHLATSPGWRQCYLDEVSEVYCRDEESFGITGQ